MWMKFRTHSAFTLIELLVVISVITLLVVGATAGYGNFSNKNLLKQSALTLKNDLRLAQANASSGKKPSSGCERLSSYRITFWNTPPDSGYTMVANCTNGPQGDTVKITYPKGITMIPLPATNPIEFFVLSKGTNIPGNISLTLSGIAGTYTLNVTNNGDIIDTQI